MGNLSYKSFQANEIPQDPRREHEVFVVLSSRFLHDEINQKLKWPEVVTVTGHGRSRTIVVDEEYLEVITDWFDRYGCNYQ